MRALLILSAASLPLFAAGTAHAQVSDAQVRKVEQEIRALRTELRRVQQEAAQRDREVRAARQAQAAHIAVPPPTQALPIMPQIPAGYALVPASPGPGGSVVLTRQAPPPASLPIGQFQVGAATITLGGYLTADSVFRTRNSVEDVQSNYTTGIPENNSVIAHESEFRLSARTSRITGLAQADPDEVTKLRAYVAIDFQGAAPTSNYNESNSWVPRLREGWLSYDRSDLGFELLAGQAWSLLTMNRVGMDPLNVNPPPSIDPNYVPGFAYARQAQIRLMKSFHDGQYRVAVSVENPATIYASTSIPSTLGTLNVSNPGVGIDATGSNATTSVNNVTTTTTGGKTTTTTTAVNVLTPGNITDDIAPDVIVKATADYDVAHLEAYALGRVFHDRLSQLGSGQSNTMFGGGAGAAALVRVVPKYLEAQVSGLAGQGISRYDPSQLPDATVNSQGKPSALPGWEALAGLTGHPIPAIDIYTFLGTSQVSPRYFDTDVKGKITAYGYGNPLYNNTGCQIELSPASTCIANTTAVVQATAGAWYRFLHGSYGTMQVGAQYAYTRRFIAQGVGFTPRADNNAVFLSVRYFPFQ